MSLNPANKSPFDRSSLNSEASDQNEIVYSSIYDSARNNDSPLTNFSQVLQVGFSIFL